MPVASSYKGCSLAVLSSGPRGRARACQVAIDNGQCTWVIELIDPYAAPVRPKWSDANARLLVFFALAHVIVHPSAMLRRDEAPRLGGRGPARDRRGSGKGHGRVRRIDGAVRYWAT